MAAAASCCGIAAPTNCSCDVSADEQLARGDFKFRLSGEKLHGDFAIVRMKGRGKGNEWLLIKKRDQFAVPGWDIEDYASSVLSGRTQEEIAQNLPAREANHRRAPQIAFAHTNRDCPAAPAKARRKSVASPEPRKQRREEKKFRSLNLARARARRRCPSGSNR